MSVNLFERIYDYENLYQAYLLARRQKRYRGQVLNFTYNLEDNLIQLQNELVWKTYKVSPYRQFKVYEPKERLISALPFRDRVVQHAICRVIEPVSEKKMLYDSFACRTGQGSLKAANRLSFFMGKAGTQRYLKCDVKKYFQSINIPTLKEIVRTYIDDPDVLWILDMVLDSAVGSGVPIGNLLSQLFANVYLNELDFYMKVKLRTKYYIRYMDDVIILDTSKEKLRVTQSVIEEFLEKKLALRLNDKTRIGKTSDGIEFVGFRIFLHNRLIKKQSIGRMNNKYRAWKRGKIPDERYLRSIGSWVGHAKGTACHELVEKVLLNSLQVSVKKRNELTKTQH
jgi:retron-type reverse transcriptase